MPLRAPSKPAPVLRVASTYGLPPAMLSMAFPALEIISSLRVQELNFTSRFYECKQHDWKIFDWNGTLRRPVQQFPTQPLLSTAPSDFYVPLDQRRPTAPYRLARVVVGAFTTLIFGHGRWPSIVSKDPETQDFADALVEATKLKTKMIRARNMAGSSGTCGLSWGFANGKPRVRVHSGAHLYVHEWADEDEFIPGHVSEIYQYPKDVFDETKRKHVRKFFWHRRDWTENADIWFSPVEVGKENPQWSVDEDKSVMHGDGVCHLVWVQNLPHDDITAIDGMPDYAGLFEQLNSVDELNSVNVNGTKLNLDPTLVLGVEQEDIDNAAVRKGSLNALAVGTGGSANYLELSGAAVEAGHKTIDAQREQILESCQCVVPDPNEVVGAGTSSVALKIVYAPMLARGDVLRDQYGDAIQRVLEGMIAAARKLNVGGEVEEHEVDDEGIEVTDAETNEPVVTRVRYEVELPPRIEEVPVLDENGEPTGEVETKEHQRTPGNGAIAVKWGRYFEETATDKQATNTALLSATGGKAVLSQQTGCEQAAESYGLKPAEEWARLRKEETARQEAEAQMFPSVGGDVDKDEDLPEGTVELPTGAEPVELAPTQLSSIITVDEARKQRGLPPWAVPVEGAMSVAAFEALAKAKEEAKGTQVGDAIGEQKGEQVSDGNVPAAEPAEPAEPTDPPA